MKTESLSSMKRVVLQSIAERGRRMPARAEEWGKRMSARAEEWGKRMSARIAEGGRVVSLCIAAMIAVIMSGCHKERRYYPSRLPSEAVSIVRFDNALMNVREESARDDIRLLYEQFPDFMPVFTENILGIPSSDTAYLAEQLPKFLNDTLYGFAATNKLEQETFGDVSQLEERLSEVFARLKYLFPDMELPEVYFFISGFNASVFFIEDGVAIGADMYLGSDYEYYNRVVYDYQKTTMRPECIPEDVVSAWLFRNIPYTANKNRLLDHIIYRGKIMYLLSVLFKEDADYEVMGYTKEQWEWCLHYERAIWNRLMDRRDLFKTEQRLLTSYINDGPFTSEISQESPGRLGTWVGWRIAESYMEHNPQVSMQELMAEPDAQKILEESYYKP